MTKITITKDYIELEGHANYDTIGKDIVCAAISMASDFLECNDSLTREIDQDGYYKLTNLKDSNSLATFKYLIGQLAQQYPLHVEVIYE
jgi:uncharacterized protein YsxB (DUF464 family)